MNSVDLLLELLFQSNSFSQSLVVKTTIFQHSLKQTDSIDMHSSQIIVLNLLSFVPFVLPWSQLISSISLNYSTYPQSLLCISPAVPLRITLLALPMLLHFLVLLAKPTSSNYLLIFFIPCLLSHIFLARCSLLIKSSLQSIPSPIEASVHS